MTSSTAILFPVMGRPHRIRSLVENIEEVTPESHRIVFAASDIETKNEILDVMAEHQDMRVSFDNGDTWPNRINRLFTITEEPYIFTGADDVQFHEGWLGALLTDMEEVDGVVTAADGHNPRGTLSLVSRHYIDTLSGCLDIPGVVIWPGYEHNWSDTELFAVAQKRGRYRYCSASMVEHLHHETGRMPMDDTYRKGLQSEMRDRQRHFQRMRMWA